MLQPATQPDIIAPVVNLEVFCSYCVERTIQYERIDTDTQTVFAKSKRFICRNVFSMTMVRDQCQFGQVWRLSSHASTSDSVYRADRTIREYDYPISYNVKSFIESMRSGHLTFIDQKYFGVRKCAIQVSGFAGNEWSDVSRFEWMRLFSNL
jgi:hypothetical protein